jgi:tetratricopeptide (TPR) repeat protein
VQQHHADVATSYLHIGAVYGQKGDLENALLQFEKALEVFLAVYGQEHLDVAASYNNMGLVYVSVSELHSPLFCVAPSENLCPPSLRTSVSVTGLITTAFASPDMVITEPCKKVRGTWSVTVSSKADTRRHSIITTGRSRSEPACSAPSMTWPHLDVAMSCNNMAIVYNRLGRHEEALVQHQKALEVFLAVHGQEHLDVAKSCQNIAAVYQKEGKRAQAIEMATKAYDINLKVLGPDHPSTRQLKSFLGK